MNDETVHQLCKQAVAQVISQVNMLCRSSFSFFLFLTNMLFASWLENRLEQEQMLSVQVT